MCVDCDCFVRKLKQELTVTSDRIHHKKYVYICRCLIFANPIHLNYEKVHRNMANSLVPYLIYIFTIKNCWCY